MNRRTFISSLIGGLAATAATRTFPFRVFSFPSEINASKIWFNDHVHVAGGNFISGFESKTPEQILNEINDILAKMWAPAKYLHRPTRLLIPVENPYLPRDYFEDEAQSERAFKMQYLGEWPVESVGVW